MAYTVDTDPGVCVATENVQPTVDDNCDGNVSFDCDDNDPLMFGANTVTCTADDDLFGNTGTN